GTRAASAKGPESAILCAQAFRGELGGASPSPPRITATETERWMKRRRPPIPAPPEVRQRRAYAPRRRHSASSERASRTRREIRARLGCRILRARGTLNPGSEPAKRRFEPEQTARVHRAAPRHTDAALPSRCRTDRKRGIARRC